MFNNILIVCLGNICRSPMAEAFFKKQILEVKPEIIISSAGIRAVIDRPAVPEVHHLLHQHGIDVSRHRGRQLTSDMIANADLILTMEKTHKKEIEIAFPFSYGKVLLMGRWSNFEIPDPYQQSLEAFDQCFELIQRAWGDWKDRIC